MLTPEQTNELRARLQSDLERLANHAHSVKNAAERQEQGANEMLDHAIRSALPRTPDGFHGRRMPCIRNFP